MRKNHLSIFLSQYKLREQYIKICNENSGILISSTEDEFKCFNKIKLYVDTIL